MNLNRNASRRWIYAIFVLSFGILACSGASPLEIFATSTSTSTVTYTPSVTPTPTRTPTKTPTPTPVYTTIEDFWKVPDTAACRGIVPDNKGLIQSKECVFDSHTFIVYELWKPETLDGLMPIKSDGPWESTELSGDYYTVPLPNGVVSVVFSVSNQPYLIAVVSDQWSGKQIVDWAEENILIQNAGPSL